MPAARFFEGVDLEGAKGVNAADPTTDQDLATKKYVDDEIAGVTLDAEAVQDIVGAMTAGNTETGITVTYQDADGTVDFEVTDSPLLGGQNSAFHLSRTNHTDTQDLATVTGHDKTAHDALLIDAATLGGSTSAQIQTAVTNAIVDSAPGTLDTLNEIAAALQDNPDVIADLVAAQALRDVTFAADLGDGVASSFDVDHSIGTKDVTVEVYLAATGETVYPTVTRPLTTRVTVDFGGATVPTAAQFRVVVQGRPDPV